ncbi:MAG: bile acid:sodium symporter family protein [Verrucomicrobiota bacterium]
MIVFRKLCLGVAALALLALIAGLFTGNAALWQPSAVALSVGLAIGLGAVPSLKGYQYTAWIIVAVVAAMIYPGSFKQWGSINLRDPWLLLIVIQFVMFGMGTQMSLHDFSGVMKTPKGVIVGLVCHFTVMPLVGFGLTKIFSFPAEIAAGIILIGSCSSGLASNVMAYIARANLGLSVTVTAITTLVAPLLTPLLMKFLAGALVPVSVFKMMMDIIEHVIVPIGAALLHDYLKHAPAAARPNVYLLAALSSVWLVFIACGGWQMLGTMLDPTVLKGVAILGFFLAAVVAGVAYHFLVAGVPRVEKIMPFLSMAGIVYFTTVTTAAGRDNLMKVGILLFFAAVIHNAAGYFFGYWLSRMAGLDRSSSRSVAFEVGLQNGGMASGLANSMGKLGTVGLAPAIFSPWMNISGSILANYWSRRPVDDKND